jgi:hypothetical protein
MNIANARSVPEVCGMDIAGGVGGEIVLARKVLVSAFIEEF